MHCPNCQTFCGDSDNFCYLCGTPLHIQTIPPSPRKGTRWVPALILFLMSVTGLILFFVTSGSHGVVNGTSETSCFEVRNGALYFREAYYSGDSELSVPAEVDGQTVFTLSDSCFSSCTNLTSIILPDTLTHVGERAFQGCTSLRGITIPASVTMIEKEAFYNCIALEAINLPSSLQQIGDHAFDGCNSLNFIFYDGTHAEWTALYDEFITPYTGVICTDGSFYQGGDLYE